MRQRIAQLLVVVGGLLLAVWAAAVAHRFVGDAERRVFLARLEQATPATASASATIPLPRGPDTRDWAGTRVAAYVEALAGGGAAEPIGVLEVPRLDLSVLVLDGIDEWSLNRGVGRIPGTAHPAAGAGNVGIAGHRDGFFRALRGIAPGDVIEWLGPQGMRRYQVEWTRVVDPEDVEVLAPTDHAALTLVTCHPFYYVGSAPERFVVRARPLGGLLAGARSR